jgi:hypothetical protein
MESCVFKRIRPREKLLIFAVVVLLALIETESISLELDPSTHRTIAVPPSFLGLSHEPLSMAKHVLPTAEYQGFIRLLSSFNTGPFIIRWGGNMQDKLIEPLDDDHWRAMRDLTVAVGARYMIGLNLKV